MKIYTKTGDDGTTGLYGAGRVSKTSLRICAIGDVDELNAVIGQARTRCEQGDLDGYLARIQNCLFDVGAELAAPLDGRRPVERVGVRHAEALERSMDEQTAKLPELRNFILPGGTPLAADLHFARCVCRRAERSVLLLHQREPVSEALRIFLNRLSDWFFVSARTANASRNVNDIEWNQTEAL